MAAFTGTHAASFMTSGQGDPRSPENFDSATRINHTSTENVKHTMPDISDVARRTFSVELNKPNLTPGRQNDTMEDDHDRQKTGTVTMNIPGRESKISVKFKPQNSNENSRVAIALPNNRYG